MKVLVRNSLLLLILICTLIIVPSNKAFAAKNKEKEKNQDQPASFSSKTISSQGYNWDYVVVTPKITKKTKALPLVFLIHGAGGNGEIYATKTGLDKKAIDSGFILVAPTGQPANPNKAANFITNPNIWNDGAIADAVNRAAINDIAFFNDLINQVQKDYNTDKKKVFVIGHSNGAGMTFRLSAELSHRITAIAPVETNNPVYNYIARRFVPTLLILGAEDPIDPLAGGSRDVAGLPWLSGDIPPATDSIQRWGQTIHCLKRIKNIASEANFGRYQYCQSLFKDTFLVYLVYNQGHEWPGASERFLPEAVSGKLNKNFKANDVIWDFFKKVKPLK